MLHDDYRMTVFGFSQGNWDTRSGKIKHLLNMKVHELAKLLKHSSFHIYNSLARTHIACT